MTHETIPHADDKDLVISRLLRAPRAALWRAWADPALLKQWWCPKPWTTEVRAFDLRPGGAFHTFMQGPDGGTSDNPGLFLEVVPQTRIVFTSVLTEGWRPATSWLPFTCIITMADEADGTRYTSTKPRVTAMKPWVSSRAGTSASTSLRRLRCSADDNPKTPLCQRVRHHPQALVLCRGRGWPRQCPVGWLICLRAEPSLKLPDL